MTGGHSTPPGTVLGRCLVPAFFLRHPGNLRTSGENHASKKGDTQPYHPYKLYNNLTDYFLMSPTLIKYSAI